MPPQASVPSIDDAVLRLAASPHLCFVAVHISPQLVHGANEALAASRETAKDMGYTVHMAVGPVAVISRRMVSMDVDAWQQVMQSLLFDGGHWVSIDLMLREGMITTWQSFAAPFERWLLIDVRPRPREVAPKYAVYDVRIRPRQDCPHGGQLQALMDEPFARLVVDSAHRVATCQVSSAGISLQTFSPHQRADVVSVIQAHVYVMFNVIATVEEVASTGDGNGEEEQVLMLRPSLKIVLDYFSKELQPPPPPVDGASVVAPTSVENQTMDPIFVEIGSQPVHVLAAVAEQHPFCKRLSFVGLKPCEDGKDRGVRTVVLLFLPAEGQATPQHAAEVERTYSLVWSTPTNGVKRPRNQLSEATTSESFEEDVLASLSLLKRNSGLAYFTTSIRAERISDVKSIVRKRCPSDDVEVHVVGNAIELRKHEPSLWRKLRAEVDDLANHKNNSNVATTVIIETLAQHKEHNDLRSKVMQRVKILELEFEQRVRQLPDGRSAHRLCIKQQLPGAQPPQHTVVVAPSQCAPLPTMVPLSLGVLQTPHLSVGPRYLAPPLSVRLEPPLSVRSEPPLSVRRLDAPYTPAVLYEQIAPFQRRLPAGWESRHVNDSVGRMSIRDVAVSSAPSPTVFLDHVAKKAYCGEPFSGTPHGGIEAFLAGNLQHLTQLHEKILAASH